MAYANAVYVNGQTPEGSGWVHNFAEIARIGTLVSADPLDAPDCATAAMRDALGAMYLGRVAGSTPRGSFTVVSADADGWRAGQTLDVRSADVGIDASFRLSRVRTTIDKPGSFRYACEFGGSRRGSSGGGGASGSGSSVVVAGTLVGYISVPESVDPEDYGPTSVYQTDGSLFLAVNQGGRLGTSPYLLVTGADGQTPRLDVNDTLATRRVYGNIGRLVYAFPVGGGPLQTPTTARNLPTSGGAIQIPIVLEAEMVLNALTIENTDTATARTAEWGLYDDRYVAAAARVASGTFSFTPPGSASVQSSGAGDVTIGSGMYYLVIRNTSGAQTFGLGEQAGGTMQSTVAKTQTLGSALGSTLDLVTGWSSITTLSGVILRGTQAGSGGFY
jgi:hypothetical protein